MHRTVLGKGGKGTVQSWEGWWWCLWSQGKEEIRGTVQVTTDKRIREGIQNGSGSSSECIRDRFGLD